MIRLRRNSYESYKERRIVVINATQNIIQQKVVSPLKTPYAVDKLATHKYLKKRNLHADTSDNQGNKWTPFCELIWLTAPINRSLEIQRNNISYVLEIAGFNQEI